MHFALVVLSTCGLFLLLGAPFLSAATVIIYAGAIIVTFLFVIMLSQQAGPSGADLRTREPALATATGFVLLATLLVGLQRVYDWRTVDAAIGHAAELARAEKIDPDYLSPAGPLDMNNVGTQPAPPLTDKARRFLDEMRAALDRVRVAAPRGRDDRRLADHRLVLDTEAAINGLEVSGFRFRDEDEVRTDAQKIADNLGRLKAVRDGSAAFDDVVVSPYGVVQPATSREDPGREPNEPRPLPAANVAAVGRTLFADHLLAVELAGTLLLVATVGAIAIAGGRREKAA